MLSKLFSVLIGKRRKQTRTNHTGSWNQSKHSSPVFASICIIWPHQYCKEYVQSLQQRQSLRL